MALFFFYYLFRYFINLFYSFHGLSFPYLRDADSRKGTLCLLCVPILKKKGKKRERERVLPGMALEYTVEPYWNFNFPEQSC